MGRSTLEPCPSADPWSIRIDTRFSRPKNHRILLANPPDWPKAEPVREYLLVSWSQCGQKQVPGPASPNHKATCSPLLSPYRGFANSIPPFLIYSNAFVKSAPEPARDATTLPRICLACPRREYGA